MKATDFCYWLQGFFELGGGAEGLTAEQVAMVRNHLNLVFYHDIDPALGGDAEKLQTIHDGADSRPVGVSARPSRPSRLDGILMRC